MISMRLVLPLLYMLTFAWCKGLQAQNLIPNPSFEDINYCAEYKEDCSPAAWRNTGLKLAKYKINASSSFGQRSMSLLLYDQARPYDRRFLQTRLFVQLEKGQRYQFSIFVKPAIKSVQHIQLHFSDELYFFAEIKEMAQIAPDLILPLPATMKVGEWFALEAEYIAKGTEKCLLIGNLLSDDDTEVVILDAKAVKRNKKKYNPQSRIYLEMDALSLRPKEEIVIQDLKTIKNKIYADHLRHSLRSDWSALETMPDKVTAQVITQDLIPKEELFVEVDALYAADEEFVLSGILFAFAEAQLTAAAFPELDRIYFFLENNSEVRIKITGHTDNIGGVQSNQQLSTTRAFSVFTYLKNKGVKESRMEFSGLGAAQPIAPNDSEAGRAANRRVSIRFLN